MTDYHINFLRKNASNHRIEKSFSKPTGLCSHQVLQSRFLKIIQTPLNTEETIEIIRELKCSLDRVDELAYGKAYKLGPVGLAYLIEVAESQSLLMAFKELNKYPINK